MVLDNIIKQNHYPIVFIGSGISKRYLYNSPTWVDLLDEYWKKLNLTGTLYKYLYETEKEVTKEKSNLEITDLDFIAYTRAASYIEQKFNDEFFNEKIKLKNLSLKQAQANHYSPFKFDLANKFKSLSLRKDIDEKELILFSKVLQKSRVIVTTNYDNLIECLIKKDSKQEPKIFIGNQGFFDDSSNGWSEIYKIHGSCEDPQSIIISKSDYEQYDKNSILISAKILSSMIDSPILFLGYSLKDRNIRKLLKDFSQQLPEEDSRKSADRIFLVEYKKNENALIEHIERDENLNFTYTLIQTDNYSELYSKVAKINEGISPYDVKRVQNIIKKIIITYGQKNSLDAYLIKPADLDKTEKDIDDGKPIVVAVGDKKNIFVQPTVIEYFSDYISEKFEINSEVALRFIASQQVNGRFPILRHYKNVNLDECTLDEFEKERIVARYEKTESDISKIISSVRKGYQQEFNTITEIEDLHKKEAATIDMITYNIKNIDIKELNKFVKRKALKRFIELYKHRNSKEAAEKSAYRKLFVAWDILSYSKQKTASRTHLRIGNSL